jgi:hypothetical protein
MQDGMNIGEWGGEVLGFLRDQMRAERDWISGLKRKLKKQGARK